jgi:hypothetical protein
LLLRLRLLDRLDLRLLDLRVLPSLSHVGAHLWCGLLRAGLRCGLLCPRLRQGRGLGVRLRLDLRLSGRLWSLRGGSPDLLRCLLLRRLLRLSWRLPPRSRLGGWLRGRLHRARPLRLTSLLGRGLLGCGLLCAQLRCLLSLTLRGLLRPLACSLFGCFLCALRPLLGGLLGSFLRCRLFGLALLLGGRLFGLALGSGFLRPLRRGLLGLALLLRRSLFCLTLRGRFLGSFLRPLLLGGCLFCLALGGRFLRPLLASGLFRLALGSGFLRPLGCSLLGSLLGRGLVSLLLPAQVVVLGTAAARRAARRLRLGRAILASALRPLG